MAAYNKFNAFVANVCNGGMNLGSDTLKVMLTNTAPVATNSVYSDISATELANGDGYTTGGAALAIASSSQSSGLYKLLPSGAGTVTWTSVTSTMGPFRYAVLYDTAGSKDLIGWWDYGSAISLNGANGDQFIATFDTTNGVFQLQ